MPTDEFGGVAVSNGDEFGGIPVAPGLDVSNAVAASAAARKPPQAPKAPTGFGGFVSGLASSVGPAASQWLKLSPPGLALTPFMDLYRGQFPGTTTARTLGDAATGINESMVQQPAEYARRMFQSGMQGNPMGVVRNLPGMVPGFGPASEQITDQAEQGNYARAAGMGTGMAAMAAAPELGERMSTMSLPRFNPLSPRSVLNPREAEAMRFMQARGVDLTPGQTFGETGLQKLEGGLENFPGSAHRAQQFFRNQQQQIAGVGSDLAATPSPISTDPYGAGGLVQQRLTQRVNRLKAAADDFYDSVRHDTAANKVSVPTGATKSVPVMGPGGEDTGLTTTAPEHTILETPVNIGNIRGQLAPLYEELQRTMPPAQRDYSPAFAAMKNVMESDQPYMNAMDFDKFLSAVKTMSRNGTSDLLSSKSQGLAKQIINAGEQEFRTAVSGAGDSTLTKLMLGRKAVQAYYNTDELLRSIQGPNAEPVRVYNNMVSGGDATFGTLQDLNKVAPAQVKTVARTFLEGLVDKATKEGGFGRSAGIMADWQRLGPQTKNLMFGPQLTSDLDNYFLAAKRLVKPEGSATAGRIASFLPVGMSGAIIGKLTGGDWGAISGAMAGAAATEYVVPNIMARVLFQPGAAKNLTIVMKAAPGSPAFMSAMEQLNRAVTVAAANRNIQGPPAPRRK